MTLEKREKLAMLFDSYKNFLTQNQKQILQLFLCEDISIMEISKILATSRQAVYDAIQKGRKKLLNIQKKLLNN